MHSILSFKTINIKKKKNLKREWVCSIVVYFVAENMTTMVSWL